MALVSDSKNVIIHSTTLHNSTFPRPLNQIVNCGKFEYPPLGHIREWELICQIGLQGGAY